jgi:hypothetical protein
MIWARRVGHGAIAREDGRERPDGCAFAHPTPSSQRSAHPGDRIFSAPGAPLLLFRCARKKSEGARDAGIPQDPRTSLPRGIEGARWRTGPLVSNRKSAVPPASRARCLRLAPRDPRWADLSGFTPTHRFRVLQHLTVGHRGTMLRRRTPGDARLAHRDHAAWAAVRGLRRPHHRHRPNPPGCPRTGPAAGASASPLPPPRSSPHSRRPMNAPSDGTR